MATVDSSAPRSARRNPTLAESAGGEPRRKVVGRIGPWQLVRLLHESDLARVYTARSADNAGDAHAAYVLKVLRNHWWRDQGAIDMQRRAAWAGQRASHPNLLPVLSAGVKQPPFYLVFPKLEGQPLRELLNREKRLPTSLALWIARQVAEGLDALHSQAGMIHADVKPANVLVADDGHATLIDLGFVHAPCDSQHWATRPVFGTLNYIAPETIASSMAADKPSDLYSLGVMLYEMLTGRLPLSSDQAEQLLRMHREKKPTCIRQLAPSVPKPVAALVHRLLAKDPLRRPDSAAEVAAELMRQEIACFAA